MLIRKNAAIGPVSLLLCWQIALAQQPHAAFSIAIVQGDGAVNYVNQRPPQVPAVRIEDPSGNAVAGAKVIFETPDSGPSATFKGARTYAAVTGRDGTARAVGFTPNAEAGAFTMHVVAEYDGQTADKQVTQNNVTPAAKPGHRKTALKIAIGAAAAAGFGVILYEEFIAKNKPYGQR
ncbi:MAG TPA: hypothetical protein VMH81_09330 [Bryobacteraceae bacterium]|nr:hypothetical protein [Bryobacteraceae bacterium]